MSNIKSWVLTLTTVLCLVLLSTGAWAMSYSEAPMLQEQVEKGLLPPVAERLPKTPMVVEPVDKIGKYGGTAHTASTRAVGWGDDAMMMGVWATLVQPTFAVDDIVAHMVRDYEVSDDKTVFTFHMREGMKWSDGHPFTVADIEFWYKDVLHNEELNPMIGQTWRAGDALGPVMELNIIDDYTFQFVFASPKPLFINEIVDAFHSAIMPKHYLKQFHVNYVPEADLKALAAKEGYVDWYELFGIKNLSAASAFLNPDMPTIGPYVLEHMTSDRRRWVRNPYFWKVDSAGNQLPYIDRIECQIVSDREVLNGMIISGSLDFAGFESDIRDYPVFRKYEDEGNYRVVLWRNALNQVIYAFNRSHSDPVLREIFSDRRFRQAMSLAIDRDEINELLYHGQGVPSQFTVVPGSQYFKPEYAEAYAEYDPARANALLDEMGLDKRDQENYRLRPDGKRLSFTLEYEDSETPKQPNVELVAEYWREVGVEMNPKIISGELHAERLPANLMDVTLHHGDGSTDIRFPVWAGRLVTIGPAGWLGGITGPEYGRWLQTGGEQGEEPPKLVKEMYEWWEEAQVTPDTDRLFELCQSILEAQAENIILIGTIAEAPFPLVVRKNLRNVPEDGSWAWDNAWISSSNPEQMFFDD